MTSLVSAPVVDDPSVLVIKVGTSSLLRPDGKLLALSCISLLVEMVIALREAGHRVVVVSSGAVGVGCQRLGLSEPPSELSKRQALAAVGQIHLMKMYDELFGTLGQSCAQVLLSYENLGVKVGVRVLPWTMRMKTRGGHIFSENAGAAHTHPEQDRGKNAGPVH